MTTYEKQAEQFLNRFGLQMTIKLGKPKLPPWHGPGEPCGNHYRIALVQSSNNKRLHFDFWGSQRDREENRAPSAYGVLACISGDTAVGETFEEFCQSSGYSTDSIKHYALFKRCSAFSKKLNEFFTKQECEALSEIQ